LTIKVTLSCDHPLRFLLFYYQQFSNINEIYKLCNLIANLYNG